jgi:predicted signal transduction protein with EAL and GGDEF domain
VLGSVFLPFFLTLFLSVISLTPRFVEDQHASPDHTQIVESLLESEGECHSTSIVEDVELDALWHSIGLLTGTSDLAHTFSMREPLAAAWPLQHPSPRGPPSLA